MRSILSSIVLALLLFGCGSSSDSTNDAMDNNFTTLRGTVPGTLIEAFCDDGSYYSVNSVKDGSEQHPFELTVPKALNCRMVMSTNEENITTKVITPIRIITPEGENTVFSGVGESADLGHIDLALDRSDIIDSGGDGVSDVPLDVQYDEGRLLVITSQDDALDSDDDGIIDTYEDDDSDGVSNRDDDDDDDDGILDVDDSDDDNDGIDDEDSDGDGVKDDDDVDDDNDGIEDEDEEEDEENESEEDESEEDDHA